VKNLIALFFGLSLVSGPALVSAEEFLTDPSLLRSEERFGEDRVYYVEDILQRLPSYQNVLVDEPVIFIAADSPYTGFKPSDLAALSELVRLSFIEGLTAQPVSFGHYEAVDQPGAGTLYVRLALKNVHIRKNKRGVLAYTPVGAIAHSAKNMGKDTLDKTTLVELTVEGELQDSQSGEVLFAVSMSRGQRADKAAKIKEEAANWEATGEIAGAFGRRLACRLDNTRLPENQRVDCIEAIQILP